MRRPLVAVYRVNAISYAIGRMLVKIPFFSLVNLLAEQRVIPELLQGDFTVQRVFDELEPLWSGPAREACLQGLDSLRARLGRGGAAVRVAELLEGAISERGAARRASPPA
jgi:lipid-A-disaccharide synthase